MLSPLFTLASCAGFTGLVFAVVSGLLLYALSAFRGRKNREGREPAPVYGSTQIELAWTIIPTLLVMVLVVATARVIHAIEDAPRPDNAVEVIAIGHQFWWEFRYPQLGVVTANELHMPVSEPGNTETNLSQTDLRDTDHSFWIPQLGGKTDLIPNRVNSMWFGPKGNRSYLGSVPSIAAHSTRRCCCAFLWTAPTTFAAWARAQQQPAAHDESVAAGLSTWHAGRKVHGRALSCPLRPFALVIQMIRAMSPQMSRDSLPCYFP